MNIELKEISILECHTFEDYPFKVKDDEAMENLAQSIQENGVLMPILVRPMEDGFEIVSEHRRVHACRLAGIETIPAIVREMSRDEAVIVMVDSNIQREELLPSEKAFAYKMKLEALSHQGKASVQVGQTSREIVAEEAGTSQSQVQRYIRLTHLEKPLLALVDEGRIALSPAVELSFLQPEEQNWLLETIESEEATPSHAQAIRMRKLSEQGELTEDTIFSIMGEEKGNQKEYYKLPAERIRKYLNPFQSRQQQEEHILKALAYYARYLDRQRGNAR